MPLRFKFCARIIVAMLSLDDRKFKKLEITLGRFSADGFPKATRDTLNITAANARKSARRIIQEKMVIKGGKSQNPALKGVQFEQTQSLNPKNQKSSVGHVAEFWPLQEFGGTVHKKGRDGVPIPTGAAANQYGTTRRTKQPTKRNRLSQLKMDRGQIRAKSRQQKNAILIAQAKKRNASKIVFLDLGKRKGIFRVQRDKVVMLHDLTRASVTLQPRPAILPAAQRQAGFIPETYERALRFQLRRAGVKV